MLTVVGPMRTGTSRVARIANQLGISMGTLMAIPPPNMPVDPEYEDWPLASLLVKRALREEWNWPEASSMFSYYIERRRRENRFPWGFKSPLLLFWWDEWVRAMVDMEEPLTTVVCKRINGNAYDSILRSAPGMPYLIRWQGTMIDKVSSVRRDLEVDFGGDPSVVAGSIAVLMGIKEPNLDAAVKGIRQ